MKDNFYQFLAKQEVSKDIQVLRKDSVRLPTLSADGLKVKKVVLVVADTRDRKFYLFWSILSRVRFIMIRVSVDR